MSWTSLDGRKGVEKSEIGASNLGEGRDTLYAQRNWYRVLFLPSPVQKKIEEVWKIIQQASLLGFTRLFQCYLRYWGPKTFFVDFEPLSFLYLLKNLLTPLISIMYGNVLRSLENVRENIESIATRILKKFSRILKISLKRSVLRCLKYVLKSETCLKIQKRQSWIVLNKFGKTSSSLNESSACLDEV